MVEYLIQLLIWTSIIWKFILFFTCISAVKRSKMNSQPSLVEGAEGAAKFVAYINVATGENIIIRTSISLPSRWSNIIIIYLICGGGHGISLHQFLKYRLLHIKWGHVLKIGKKILMEYSFAVSILQPIVFFSWVILYFVSAIQQL